MKIENEILQKVNKIINLEYDQFCQEFPLSQIATGERTVDFVEHFIEVDKEIFLLVSFVDFSLNSFSIIDKKDLDTIIERKTELFYE